MDGHSLLRPVTENAVISSLFQMPDTAAVFPLNGNMDVMIFAQIVLYGALVPI